MCRLGGRWSSADRKAPFNQKTPRTAVGPQHSGVMIRAPSEGPNVVSNRAEEGEKGRGPCSDTNSRNPPPRSGRLGYRIENNFQRGGLRHGCGPLATMQGVGGRGARRTAVASAHGTRGARAGNDRGQVSGHPRPSDSRRLRGFALLRDYTPRGTGGRRGSGGASRAPRDYIKGGAGATKQQLGG